MGRFRRHAMQVDMSAAKGANAMHKACMKKQALMRWTKRNNAIKNIVLNTFCLRAGVIAKGCGAFAESGGEAHACNASGAGGLHCAHPAACYP